MNVSEDLQAFATGIRFLASELNITVQEAAAVYNVYIHEINAKSSMRKQQDWLDNLSDTTMRAAKEALGDDGGKDG